MLEKIRHTGRNPVRNTVVAIIFSAITVVFILWGISPRNAGISSGGDVAEVNGQIISIADFQFQRDRMSDRYANIGLHFDSDAQRQWLNMKAVGALIELELVAQGAGHAGLKISNDEVRDEIVNIPFLQKDGRFQRDYYENFLDHLHLTPTEFENRVRRDALYQKASRLFEQALSPMGPESIKQQELSSTKMNISFVRFDRADLNPKISDKQVAEFLGKKDSQGRLENYYQANIDTYSSKEKLKLRQIFIHFDYKDPKSLLAAQKKIQEIRARAEKENFAQLAHAVSEDPGTRDKVVEVARGEREAAFEMPVFELPLNKVSQPIRTAHGYYLVKVLNKTEGQPMGLAKVRDQVARDLLAHDGSEKAMTALRDDLQKGNVQAVESFVKTHKIKWTDTGDFALAESRIPKLGDGADFTQAIMGLSKDRPLASQPVYQGESVYVLKLKDRTEPGSSLPLDHQAEETLVMQESQEAMDQWAKGLQSKADIRTNADILKQ